MKYQFIILIDQLPQVLEVYKKTGGYLEVERHNDLEFVTITSDNLNFLYHNDFKRWTHPLIPFGEQGAVPEKMKSNYGSNNIQKRDKIEIETMRVLSEVTNRDKKQGIGIDVSEIKLQRMKRVEKQFIDFKLEKRRMKWELIKSLQEEFDKLPDDLEFTSFRAVGIGIGRSIYF